MKAERQISEKIQAHGSLESVGVLGLLQELTVLQRQWDKEGKEDCSKFLWVGNVIPFS